MSGNSENINPENNISLEDKEFVEAIEHALNETYPGATLYIYDSKQPEEIIEKYTPGRIIREPSILKVSSFSKGGLKTNLRIIVISSHLISVDEILEEEDIDELLEIKGCGIHVAQRDSHFKILDNYKVKEKTLITLLHLPDDESWKFFINLDNSSGDDAEFITYCRKVFEERIDLPVRKELDSDLIEKIWENAPGFNYETNEFFDEEDKDSGSSEEYHFRYLLEHKVLPEAVYKASKTTISMLTVRKEEFLKNIADQLAERTNETNPFTESDFKVIPIPAKNRNCLLIVMPHVVKELQCRRIYITFTLNAETKTPEHVRYFTVEKGEQTKNKPNRDFLCEWTAEGHHVNHGTVECIAEEAMIIEVLSEGIDLRRDVELNTMYELFFNHTKDIIESIQPTNPNIVFYVYDTIAKESGIECPFSLDNLEANSYESEERYLCQIFLPKPEKLMQCSRIYFSSKKDFTEPMYFMVEKRFRETDDGNLTDCEVLFGRTTDQIFNLGTVESVNDDMQMIFQITEGK